MALVSEIVEVKRNYFSRLFVYFVNRSRVSETTTKGNLYGALKASRPIKDGDVIRIYYNRADVRGPKAHSNPNTGAKEALVDINNVNKIEILSNE